MCLLHIYLKPKSFLLASAISPSIPHISVFVQTQRHRATPKTREPEKRKKSKNKSKISIWFQFSAILLVCLKFVSLGRDAAVWCVCASSSAAFRMLFIHIIFVILSRCFRSCWRWRYFSFLFRSIVCATDSHIYLSLCLMLISETIISGGHGTAAMTTTVTFQWKTFARK